MAHYAYSYCPFTLSILATAHKSRLKGCAMRLCLISMSHRGHIGIQIHWHESSRTLWCWLLLPTRLYKAWTRGQQLLLGYILRQAESLRCLLHLLVIRYRSTQDAEFDALRTRLRWTLTSVLHQARYTEDVPQSIPKGKDNICAKTARLCRTRGYRSSYIVQKRNEC